MTNNETISIEKVIEALKQVEDPDLKKDLVTLNMVKDIQVEGKKVRFTVVLTTPACPLKEAIRSACINAIKLLVDKDAVVEVEMTAQVRAAQNNQILPTVKNIIAISSGKGGVGKSTISTYLAMSLMQMGAKVGLVDADVYGPSIPILFGFDEAKPEIVQIQGRDKFKPFVRNNIKLMSMGVLVPKDRPIVWRGPMATKALNQLVIESDWGEIDYLLVDLPPGTGDVHLSLVQAVPVTAAVVITTPQKIAVADARKGAEMFRMPQIKIPILGVVENMSYFTPEDAPDKKYPIFGQGGGAELAKALNTTLLGQVPFRMRIRENGDEGKTNTFETDPLLQASFDQIAQSFAQQLAIRNAELSPTKKVEITTS